MRTPGTEFMEPLSKLQVTIYNAYLIGLEPSECLRARINAVHDRIRVLNDWLYLELLTPAAGENSSLAEMVEKFRAEERARESALKGAQASAAPASSHTH